MKGKIQMSKKSPNYVFLLRGMLLCIVIFTGCATPVVREITEFEPLPAPILEEEQIAKAYYIQVGDVMSIKFYNNPALNEEVVVRPDGLISIQPIGEVKAEGLTPLELENELQKRFINLLAIPDKIKNESDRVPARGKYYLRIGDLLEIKFYQNSELNQVIPVRPDGKISLEPIGEIQAEWRTPDELRDELMQKYAEVFTSPKITVIVKEFAVPEIYHGGRITVIVRKYATQFVYVGGEVYASGLIPLDYRKEITALEAVIQQGGFKNTGDPTCIVILRNSGEENPSFLLIDLKSHLRLKSRQDIILQPYDIVWVPKSRISTMIEFMDQYFNQLIPVYKTIGVGFNYDLNPSEVRVKD